MSAFSTLKIGDTFSVEEKEGEVKYIKIEDSTTNLDENIFNTVCIDEYSDKKGKLKFFSKNQNCSHVNWS